MTVERVRPIKMFEVVVAYGPYRVGDKVQPTGLYRDVLLRRGVIREVPEAAAAAEARQREEGARGELPGINRMVSAGALANRGRGRRA